MTNTVMSEADQETAFNELVNGQADTPNAGNGNAEQTNEQALTTGLNPVSDQPAEQGQGGGEVDIWANASPEQKAALDELTRKAKQAENNVRAQAGRMSALQRQINEMSQQAITPTPEGNDDEDNDLSSYEEELPEVAELTRKVVEREVAKVRQETAAQLKPFQEQQQQEFAKTQFDLLAEAHPDYAEVSKSPEFSEWIDNNAHNANVMGMYQSDMAEDNINLLNAFKFSRSQFTSQSTNNPTPNETFDPMNGMVAPDTAGIPSGGSAYNTDDEEALFNLLVDGKG